MCECVSVCVCVCVCVCARVYLHKSTFRALCDKYKWLCSTNVPIAQHCLMSPE